MWVVFGGVDLVPDKWSSHVLYAGLVLLRSRTVNIIILHGTLYIRSLIQSVMVCYIIYYYDILCHATFHISTLQHAKPYYSIHCHIISYSIICYHMMCSSVTFYHACMLASWLQRLPVPGAERREGRRQPQRGRGGQGRDARITQE